MVSSRRGKRASRHEKSSIIRGHHIYKSIWTPFIGGKLAVADEEGNEQDCHTVAVMKDCHIVRTSHSTAADT